MKKSIVHIVFTLIISAVLCGCGSNGNVDSAAPTSTITAPPTATVSPMITPDTNIGSADESGSGTADKKTDVMPSTEVTNNGTGNDMAKTSPNASTAPSATAKQ